ncbi:unnamed protein product [Soboliphyme baturini]|uniref:Uncharacterized protein n=1 Tax=Soboliphyme baturini TaxID=241478 RepID=A0A183I9A4_9BILA|nr:unnamed protein product [Soboliphyme baturini]
MYKPQANVSQFPDNVSHVSSQMSAILTSDAFDGMSNRDLVSLRSPNDSKCNLFNENDTSETNSFGTAAAASGCSDIAQPRLPSPGNERYQTMLKEAFSTIKPRFCTGGGHDSGVDTNFSFSERSTLSTDQRPVIVSHDLSDRKTAGPVEWLDISGFSTVSEENGSVADSESTRLVKVDRNQPLSFTQAIRLHDSLTAVSDKKINNRLTTTARMATKSRDNKPIQV